jgi:hypothetical protein
MFNQQDSNQGSGASGSQPGSPSTPGVQQNSVDLDALLNALETNPKLSSLLERKLQSVKDQRFARQEKKLTEFQAQLQRLEELQKSGMSKDQALNFMELESRLDNLAKQQPSKPDTANSVGNAVSGSGDIDTDAFLRAVGIDPTDPDVTSLYKSGSITPDQLVTFVTKKKSAAPAASPAQAAPVSSGVPNQESLEEQYTTEVRKLPPGSADILEVRRRYRKLGLNI